MIKDDRQGIILKRRCLKALSCALGISADASNRSRCYAIDFPFWFTGTDLFVRAYASPRIAQIQPALSQRMSSHA